MVAPQRCRQVVGLPILHTKLPEPLPEFSCFLKLPIELRLGIWNLAMLPRTVDIHIRPIGSLDTIEWELAELYSNTPVPVTLQACQESRIEGLRVYKLCFGTHMISAGPKEGTFSFARNPRTYFSYAMDTANFKYDGKLERKLPLVYMKAEDVLNIRHIRTDWCVGVSPRLIDQISCFDKLESLGLTWHWREMMSEGMYDGVSLPDVEVTEDNYQKLKRRPDITQFMTAFITARDVFAPGMKIPLLKVKSLSNDEFMNNLLQIFDMFLPQRASS